LVIYQESFFLLVLKLGILMLVANSESSLHTLIHCTLQHVAMVFRNRNVIIFMNETWWWRIIM